MLGFVCGPAIWRTKSWGVRYVDFERVERVLHRVFSDSEIADAAEGRPDRSITLKENTGCPEHHRQRTLGNNAVTADRAAAP